MTIPMLQGSDDVLGPSLASLTDTLGSLLKPTAKYDQALKQIFLEKPELMQKFVDIEKANPGTMKAFGFGEGATNFLSGMQESIQSIKERHLAPEVDAALSDPGTAKATGKEVATGKTEAQMAGEKLQTWMLNGGLDLIRSDPRSADAAIRKTLGIKSADEMKVDTDTMQAYDAGRALKDRSIPEIVSGIANGTIKADAISGGMLNPHTSAAVKAGLHQYQQDRDDVVAQGIANTRAQALAGKSGSPTMLRAKYTAAYDQYKASGGVAPIGAFYEVINGEPYNETPASAEDVQKVKEFLETTQSTKAVAQRAAVLKSIEPLYNSVMIRKKGVKAVTKDFALGQIRKMNDVLTAANSPWRAEYDQVGHWFKANEPQIILRDNKGMITNDFSAVASEVPGVNTYRAKDLVGAGLGPSLNGEQQKMAAYLRSLPVGPARDSVIDAWFEADSARGGDGSNVNAILDASGEE